MAIQDQIAQTPIFSGDEVFYNYGTTDIPANTVVALDTTNCIGDSNGDATPGIVLPTLGGNPTLCVGITLETIKAKQTGRVRTSGLAWAVADGAISPGAIVDASPNSNKAGLVTAHSAAKNSLGAARSKAADGDPVLIYVDPSANA